jgi:hypothetical protein
MFIQRLEEVERAFENTFELGVSIDYCYPVAFRLIKSMAKEIIQERILFMIFMDITGKKHQNL